VRGRRGLPAAGRDVVRLLLGDLDGRAAMRIYNVVSVASRFKDGVELAQGVAVDDVDGGAVADIVVFCHAGRPLADEADGVRNRLPTSPASNPTNSRQSTRWWLSNRSLSGPRAILP